MQQAISTQLQAAVDEIGKAGGGVLFVPEGLYKLDSTIQINYSNVILRGAGSDKTKFFAPSVDNEVMFHVYAGWPQFEENAGWQLSADAKTFDTFVSVDNASGLKVGDDILISWKITSGFKNEHNSGNYWTHVDVNDYANFFRRTITKVENNKVYFKVPLRYDINDSRDAAKIRKYRSDREYYSEVGLESFGVSNATGSLDKTWGSHDQVSAIQLFGCKDCWIRGIKSFQGHSGHDYHLRSHGIEIINSFRVTVDGCHLQKSEHLGIRGNGYLYQVSSSNEVLVKNSIGHMGRHNFSINWDFGASGNVFFNVQSSGARVCDQLADLKANNCHNGTNDTHHALHMVNLFDHSNLDDGLSILNREDASNGAGQTGTQNVVWNVQASNSTIDSYNFGMGYVIGTPPGTVVNTDLNLKRWDMPGASAGTGPRDYEEFIGSASQLSPSSLYVDQLKKRLGISQ